MDEAREAALNARYREWREAQETDLNPTTKQGTFVLAFDAGWEAGVNWAYEQAPQIDPYRRGFLHKTIMLGGFIVTTVNQGTTRSWIDRCWTTTREGVRGEGYAIHLKPWNRNAWGEINMGKALVVARVRKQRP